MTTLPTNLKMGCPVWAYAPWVGNFFTSDAKRADYLKQYGSVFNTVEGNSSFYGLPSAPTIQRWCHDVPEDFHFCFKFPRVVSHDLLLRNAEKETAEFIERLAPLGNRLGPFFLQLPPHFEGRHLSYLSSYLEGLPNEYGYAVEVRNNCFFSGRQDEIDLNALLQENGVDRVIFDSRALFKGKASDEDTENAQRRKPNLPVNIQATANRPFIRFVGHPESRITDSLLKEWVNPLMNWMKDGKTPYFFVHMPDEVDAPSMARLFLNKLMRAGLDTSEMVWPCEREVPSATQMKLFNE